MPASNTFFAIAFGDYDLVLDRETLSYRLTETKTGTIWAENLPLGSVTLEERATGELATHDFGAATLFSISEKAGAQGKEILFGLDCAGVPVDVYVSCSEREIKLTVEANRDTKTHRVHSFALLPGLCRAPDDGASYLVLPRGEGALVFARDLPLSGGEVLSLPVWDACAGLTMPFAGAVRETGETRSALALVTDSAYATLNLARDGSGAAADLTFARDPERRRLEVRIVALPGADHVGVARTYREKVIADRQHVLLRRKSRERPVLDFLLGGGALVTFGASADVRRIADDLKNALGVERAVCLFDAKRVFQVADALSVLGYVVGLSQTLLSRDGLPEAGNTDHALLLPGLASDALEDDFAARQARWDDLDRRTQTFARAREHAALVGSNGGCDWAAPVCDFFLDVPADPDETSAPFTPVPLYAAVYHDSVVTFGSAPLTPAAPRRFLRALLALSPPFFHLADAGGGGLRDYVRRAHAVLGPLYRLTFPAFLTGHRFLTPDCLVEETRWSNGARVIINQREDALFRMNDADELITLPPLGFLAEHAQMIAHNALVYKGKAFSECAWRVARSRDDKPLSESGDVLRQEFGT